MVNGGLWLSFVINNEYCYFGYIRVYLVLKYCLSFRVKIDILFKIYGILILIWLWMINVYFCYICDIEGII